MIMYKYTCERCGNTWEMTPEEAKNRRPPLIVQQLKHKGMYKEVDLCTSCFGKIFAFLYTGADITSDPEKKGENNEIN